MIIAWEVASALTQTFLETVHRGAPRPILGLDIADSSESAIPTAGDLMLAVGFADADDLADLLGDMPAVAGLVVRRTWADSVVLRSHCEVADVTLLALAEGATWSVVAGLMKTIIDASASGGEYRGAPDRVYAGLFDMADMVSAIVEAPVTIEDFTSRVVAYSTGQDDVDEARMESIFGRQVPRWVRDHFRSLGVFRRLSRSDEPFYIPADAGDVRGRYVIPVHAGGEWLGSVWAVTDAPVCADRGRELRAAAELIALHLLRLRAQGELAQQVQLDQVRSALRGAGASVVAGAGHGPWRVVVLNGPDPNLDADARRELWLAVARRSGWKQPQITDLDGRIYAVLRASGIGPGTWAWLSELVQTEWKRRPAVRALASVPSDSLEGLVESRRQADELDRLGGSRPVMTLEEAWPQVTLARAVNGLAQHTPVSPLHPFLEAGNDPEGTVVDTLAAVIDHWGEPRRAARQLGVHPNTVRYRLAHLAPELTFDLDDPVQRLALRLEIGRLRDLG